MRRLEFSDILFAPLEDPVTAAPAEVLVLDATPADAPTPSAAELPGAPAEAAIAAFAPIAPLPDTLGTEVAPARQPDAAAPATLAATEPPAFTLLSEDAFPTLAELDAILAANAGPPPGPDAAERAGAIALLGLDPAIAADPDLYAAILAGLPGPDADAILARWLSETESEAPPCQWEGTPRDWQIG